jgi:thymidine phosphorylase
VTDGTPLRVSHASRVASFGHVRAKLYGHRLELPALREVIEDIGAGRYHDVHIAAFLTACAGNRLDVDEISSLTHAMIEAGERLEWAAERVVDKHCVGGLPGNRTTPIVVAIVAAAGLTMPKTSSRAITSPAGTADVMETITNVELDLHEMKSVVDQHGGCLVWGGAVSLSPVDDLLIHVERALDVDSEGQLVASVLSKKAAAGSTHVLIDIPWGPTAKVRSLEAARWLARDLEEVGRRIGLAVTTVLTDGRQPVGRGIGPALEARDVLAVLRGDEGAPVDLRERALDLAGRVLELGEVARFGHGRVLAQQLLDDGAAWERFRAICKAQGWLHQPPVAPLMKAILARSTGVVVDIDNRRLARVAKFAGAPADPSAGLVLHKRLGDWVEEGEPLFTIHAESEGERAYALDYLQTQSDIIRVEPPKETP